MGSAHRSRSPCRANGKPGQSLLAISRRPTVAGIWALPAFVRDEAICSLAVQQVLHKNGRIDTCITDAVLDASGGMHIH